MNYVVNYFSTQFVQTSEAFKFSNFIIRSILRTFYRSILNDGPIPQPPLSSGIKVLTIFNAFAGLGLIMIRKNHNISIKIVLVNLFLFREIWFLIDKPLKIKLFFNKWSLLHIITIILYKTMNY